MKQPDGLAVSFKIVNFDGAPEQFTKITGIKPSRSWKVGEVYGDHGAIRTHSRWELISPAGRNATVGVQLASLLDLLEPVKESILAATAEYDAELSISGYVNTVVNPEINLSSSQITRLAELGLSLDIDLYALDE